MYQYPVLKGRQIVLLAILAPVAAVRRMSKNHHSPLCPNLVAPNPRRLLLVETIARCVVSAATNVMLVLTEPRVVVAVCS
jgi:hypothetical protein